MSLGSISFGTRPLCIGLIGIWLSFSGSRHKYNVPLGFGTIMELLHHLAILSVPSGASI